MKRAIKFYAIFFTVWLLVCVFALTAFSHDTIKITTSTYVTPSVILVQVQKTPCQKGKCPQGTCCQRGYCVPCPPLPPPKPQFATPLRDAAWKAKIKLEKQLWYSRYKRYKRLEGLLGPQVIVPLQPIPVEPLPVPEE